MVYKAYRRILVPPAGSFFLFGPRGVGKSTWARKHFRTAHTINLLDESVFQSYLADPSLFAGEIRHLRPGAWVVVDEVQRLPGLLNDVHRLMEERRLRFVLLGSSARKLKTSGTNLLAGRAVRRVMFPLVPAELGRDFNIERVLTHGSLPVIWQSPDRADALRAYVQLYLKEEIRAEALVRNLPGFARFLPIAALFHGQVINVSKIARDAGTARTTVSDYLDILDDTLLTFRLPAFEARLRVRERRHPKLYWVDSGLVRAVKGQLGPLAAEERGALLEGWVLNLLRAYAETMPLYDEISYWAPLQANQLEVDLLLRRGGKYLAIEVKSAARYSAAWLSGLRAIQELDGIARRILVYTGPRPLTTADGINVWPITTFARAVAQGRLWP